MFFFLLPKKLMSSSICLNIYYSFISVTKYGQRIIILKAPYFDFSRTGDPRENCWKGGRGMNDSMLVPRREISEVASKGRFSGFQYLFFFFQFDFIFKVALLNYVVGIKKGLIHCTYSLPYIQ